MRYAFLTGLICATLVGCGKKSSEQANGPVEVAPVATGFVEISFDDDDDDDMDEMMQSDWIRDYAECSNLMRLEPSAMMGKLSQGEINCLEDMLRDTDRQTYKRKLSLLLMSDSWAKGEKLRWEAVVARHLEQIDRSDPDLCYKYALFLSKKGPSNAAEAIRWADVALENRTRWSGDTHVARVYSLYRLQARAALSEWMDVEQRLAETQDESLRTKADEARNQTKTLSRQWLEYARSSGKDSTSAFEMCRQAAGTDTFCMDG